MSESRFLDPQKERFEVFVESLIDLPVSHIWRGYGSALFLEFGKLTPRVLKTGRKLRNDSGEMGLSITWSWRIENENSIVAGSWSEDSEWSKYFEQFLGSRVASASLFGRLPEIELRFSNGMYLCSMMTAEGDPSWSISNRRAGIIESVGVVSGRLSWECSEDDALLEKS